MRDQAMLLGKKPNRRRMRVIFPRQHEVDEKGYETDRQEGFSQSTAACGDYPR